MRVCRAHPHICFKPSVYMPHYYQQRIIESKAALPLVALLVALVWVESIPWPSEGVLLLEKWDGGILVPNWLAGAVCLLACVATIYLLAGIEHNYTLMGRRTTFSYSLLLLLWGSFPSFSHSIEGNILLCLLAIELSCLYGCYQQSIPIEQTFLLFLTVSIGCIVSWTHVIYVPLYYALLVFLQGLSARSFFAGLAGLLFPYWWLFVYAYVADKMDVFLLFIPSIIGPLECNLCSSAPLIEWILYGYIAILFISGTVYLLRNDFQSKLRTRALLYALLWWTYSSVIIFFLLPNNREIHLSSIVLGTSIIVGYMFSHSSGKISNWCFLLALLALLLILIFRVWMPQYLSF